MKACKILMILLVAAVFSASRAEAGNRDFEKITGKYSSCRNVEIVTISSELLEMLSTSENNELLKDLDWIKIMNLNDPHATPDIYNNLKKDIAAMLEDGYEELMTVSGGQSEMRIYIKRKDKDMLFFTSDEHDCFTAIHISGKITKTLTQALLNNEISLN